ncbi:hypothetical protein ACFE04_009034 [Oxalis oulophora]
MPMASWQCNVALQPCVTFSIIFTKLHKEQFFFSFSTFTFSELPSLNHLCMALISSVKSQSRKPCRKTFMGVRRRAWGKWVSEIRIPRQAKRIWLGSYDLPEKAARAYDAAKFCIHGKNGPFNFPGHKMPELPEGSTSPLPIKQIQAIAASFALHGQIGQSKFPSKKRTVLCKRSPTNVSVPPQLSAPLVPRLEDEPFFTDLMVSTVYEPFGHFPICMEQAGTDSLGNLQFDFMFLDVDWINEFF